MPNVQVTKVIYYVAAITFHLILLFTNAGNYFHGGTPVESVALQAAAVLISATLIELLQKVGTVEKIFVLLCAVVPVTFVVWSLLSLIGR